jgi:hypothetical protein
MPRAHIDGFPAPTVFFKRVWTKFKIRFVMPMCHSKSFGWRSSLHPVLASSTEQGASITVVVCP